MTPRRGAVWLPVAGVVLIALNLRAGVTSTAALTAALESALGLGATTVALLPALPTLCFALAGPAALPLSRRYGVEGAMSMALVALTAGLILRTTPATWALLAGTALGMSGLAIAAVILPSVVRTHFPGRVHFMTGLYTTTMAASATIGAAVAVPLAREFGSATIGLGLWALPAAVALAVWLCVPRTSGGADDAPRERVSLLDMARTRLGALVTAYFALQALNCYALIGILPRVLSDAGMSEAGAGGVLAVSQFIGIPATFALLAITRRPERLRAAFIAVSLSMLAGFGGLILAPITLPTLWAALAGFGFCSFPLVLAVIGSSGSGPAENAALSALAQSLGYLVAALGPFTVGVLHAATGGWTTPMIALTITAAAQLVAGIALTSGKPAPIRTVSGCAR
ncbi:MFS transporter [Nocardia crassostreae]|uniref:MFS transporter n=1 Tax=Nocardia crassostreae TaxID=53428 RepID=UPI0014725419|nr:MFS transporter [Nocardia crassostreae]